MQIFQGRSNCLIPLSVVQTSHLLARQGTPGSGTPDVYRLMLKNFHKDFLFQMSSNPDADQNLENMNNYSLLLLVLLPTLFIYLF